MVASGRAIPLVPWGLWLGCSVGLAADPKPSECLHGTGIPHDCWAMLGPVPRLSAESNQMGICTGGGASDGVQVKAGTQRTQEGVWTPCAMPLLLHYKGIVHTKLICDVL